jgi:adenylate cyclase
VATLSRYKQWNVDDAEPPSAARSPADRDAVVFAENIATAASASTEPAHVLVVDDKEANRDQMRTFLERDGHTVATANDGLEALDALRSDEFDLVLLDLVMPEMNGYQVLRIAKSDDRLKHTPIIVVSGFCDVDHVVACIEAGAEDQLPKPVDLKLLRARVNTCLEKKRLREREFGQFFTPELARYYVRHPEKLTEGRDTEVSLLFCDIRRFSLISESLEPAETVRWLSDVMNELSECVMRHRGVLVDYIGDEIVAMWGAPDEEQTDHAQLACLAAVDMLAALPAINERWQAVIGHPTDVGIGINTGVARVGNTGSSQKFKYGPLGNTVNLASRVQGATKYLKSQILVTGATHGKLSSGFPARRVCTVRVVNIDAPIELYEILADPENVDFKAPYEQALQHFESQQCAKAAALLGGLLSSDPPDGPSVVLMSRVADELLKPSAEFDPVWELPGK